VSAGGGNATTTPRQPLLVALITLGLAGPGRAAFAGMPDQMPSDHLRSSSAVIATLIQQATDRSHTFRGLVDTINDSDGIVYVEEGKCSHGMRACFVNVTMAGPNRLLWVMVDTHGVDCDLMGLIGHELRHTIEVLGDPHVTSFSAMYFFYTREVEPGGTFPFETREAKDTGEAVRAEVRGKRSCGKIH
jgi:hypothetical protein